jgi:restriction system protein
MSSRPWIVPIAIGVLLLLVSRSLVVLAFLLLVVGLVAAAGSRRARARFALRSAGIGEADYMDGTTFEHFTAEVLRANGYRVEHVGQTADYGADLIITDQSGRAVVQVKRYSSNVGVDAVREAAAARAHYGTHAAIVLTNSYFTPHAISLARSNAVDLWDRSVLVNLAVQMI